MWKPRPLTPLWAFTACYRDSFTFFFLLYSSTIHDFATRWRWVVSFITARPLYPGERAPCVWYMRLGGPQSRSGRCGVENNRLLLKGIDPWPSSGSLYRLLALHSPLFTYDSWFRGGFFALTSILPLGIRHRFYVGWVTDVSEVQALSISRSLMMETTIATYTGCKDQRTAWFGLFWTVTLVTIKMI
jgi:hypothetical protein